MTPPIPPKRFFGPKDQYEKLIYKLMTETEKLLGELEDIKKLNKILMAEVILRRKARFTPEEDSLMIRFYVACEIEREEERWEATLLKRIKGGFKHESPL